jgi:hypothetical protein
VLVVTALANDAVPDDWSKLLLTSMVENDFYAQRISAFRCCMRGGGREGRSYHHQLAVGQAARRTSAALHNQVTAVAARRTRLTLCGWKAHPRVSDTHSTASQ